MKTGSVTENGSGVTRSRDMSLKERRHAVQQVEGYFRPRPNESREAAFARAKGECVKDLQRNLACVEALSIDLWRSELQSRGGNATKDLKLTPSQQEFLDKIWAATGELRFNLRGKKPLTALEKRGLITLDLRAEACSKRGSRQFYVARPSLTINGHLIQVCASGAGHRWGAADEDGCPANIQEEIAAEIIDGRRSECHDFVASNGLHYRWN